MGGPWDKFKKSESPQEGGAKPWDKFAKSTLRESGTVMDQVPAGEQAAPQEGMLDRLRGAFTSAGRDKFRAAADEQSAADLASRKSQSARGTGLAQTELEQSANALTLGYLPQIEAAGAAAMGDDYVSARDANVKRLAAQAEEHPVPALGGTIAGGLLGARLMPMPTVFKGAGLLSKVAQGALTGGVMGGAMNPGDQEGVVDPVQADARLENAKGGAAFGAKVAGGAAAGQKIAQGVSAIGQKMKGAGEGAAFKSTGAMLKDFRQAFAKDKVEDMGRFVLDRLKLKAGDTYQSIAQKAEAMRADAGKRLDDVYNKATQQFEKGSSWKAQAPGAPGRPNPDRPLLTGKTAPVDIEMTKQPQVGIDLARDKAEILKAAAEDLGNSEGKAAALNRLEKYLDERAVELGSGVLPPRAANDIKGAIDEVINYSRNPLAKEPTAEKAFGAARKLFAQKIERQIEETAKQIGDPALVKALKEANLDYGYSKQIGQIAADRVNRVSANNAFGLSDRMAGGAGAIVAGAASAASGSKDPSDILTTGLGAGLLAAGGNHLAQKYGNSVMARGLDRTAPIAQGAGQLLGAGARGLLTPEVQRLLLLEQMRKKRGLVREGIISPEIQMSGETP